MKHIMYPNENHQIFNTELIINIRNKNLDMKS